MQKKNKVAIISRESDDMTIDIRLLEKELTSRGIEVEVLCKLLRKKFALSSLAYFKYISLQKKAIRTSGVVIVDTYCIPVSLGTHSRDTKVVQMWHALSAIKKFGWQTVGKPDGTNSIVAHLMKMHNGYDYVLAPSDVTAKHFCEGFRTDKNKIVKLGLPRIDYILSEDTHITKRIREKYGLIDDNRKIILYAPTFRKGKNIDVSELSSKFDSEKYVIIAKLHPLDIKLYKDGYVADETKEKNNCEIIVDDEYNTYDWLKVCDIIISDYSSLIVEASLVNKPIYLYTFDEEEYSKSTGLNVSFDEEAIGKYKFSDSCKLADEIDKNGIKGYDFTALRDFRNKYIAVSTDNCTGKLADFIENLLSNQI